MFTRTLQTIKNSTELVHQFKINGIHDEFQLRSLKVRKARPHYILVLASSLHRKHFWEDIKVVSELNLTPSKVRFCISIASQYPEFSDIELDIQQEVTQFLIQK